MKTGPKPRNFAEIYRLISLNSIYDGDCKLYQGYRTRGGYGLISMGYDRFYIHRLVYEQHNGPIEKRLVIRHSCDRPNCWEISHLIKGTHADNVADKVARGRQCRGEGHYLAKLTRYQADIIKESSLNSGELSRMFNVSRSTIRQIQRGETWK